MTKENKVIPLKEETPKKEVANAGEAKEAIKDVGKQEEQPRVVTLIAYPQGGIKIDYDNKLVPPSLALSIIEGAHRGLKRQQEANMMYQTIVESLLKEFELTPKKGIIKPDGFNMPPNLKG